MMVFLLYSLKLGENGKNLIMNGKVYKGELYIILFFIKISDFFKCIFVDFLLLLFKNLVVLL